MLVECAPSHETTMSAMLAAGLSSREGLKCSTQRRGQQCEKCKRRTAWCAHPADSSSPALVMEQLACRLNIELE